jgi:hypothetical protein
MLLALVVVIVVVVISTIKHKINLGGKQRGNLNIFRGD